MDLVSIKHKGSHDGFQVASKWLVSVSDAEQTWRATLDHFETFTATKWCCSDMQQRLDFWTPFLPLLLDLLLI